MKIQDWKINLLFLLGEIEKRFGGGGEGLKGCDWRVSSGRNMREEPIEQRQQRVVVVVVAISESRDVDRGRNFFRRGRWTRAAPLPTIRGGSGCLLGHNRRRAGGRWRGKRKLSLLRDGLNGISFRFFNFRKEGEGKVSKLAEEVEIIGQDEGRGGNRNSIPEFENFYLSTDNNFEEFINTLFEAWKREGFLYSFRQEMKKLFFWKNRLSNTDISRCIYPQCFLFSKQRKRGSRIENISPFRMENVLGHVIYPESSERVKFVFKTVWNIV